MFRITSTYSMTASLRSTIANLQTTLSRSQKELATGRHADLGVALGIRASRSFTLEDARQGIATLRATNHLVSARLNSTQTVLDALAADARDMRASLLSAQTDGGQRSAIVAQARQALTALVAGVNSADGDGFLFGGVKNDQAPLVDFFADPPASNKLALDAAFSDAFGFGPTDPAVSGVSESQIQSFLAGGFQAQFSNANWKAYWSRASDRPLRSQVGLSRIVDTSITANEPALQKLAEAYVMISGLGVEQLSQKPYLSVLKVATETIDAAIGMLTHVQAHVGVTQRTVQNSDEIMTIQSDTVLLQLHDLEGVDQTETAARVNGLMTQIETAYTLTSRINQLSLARYL